MRDQTGSCGPLSAPGWRRLLGDVVGLLLPVECPGCGAWDVALCRSCELLLREPLRRCESRAAAVAGLPGSTASRALPTWCVAAYRGAVRGVVLSWKGRGGRVLGRAVGRAGRLAGSRCWDALESLGLLQGDGRGGPLQGSRPTPGSRAGSRGRGTARLVVVPAPSGWQRRVRGRLVVRALALEVAAGLRQGSSRGAGRGTRIEVADVLRRGRGRAHLSGLDVAARTRNRRRSMRLVGTLAPASRCLLVDDVLTTGATLAECRRVLESAGHVVVGALVLAATPVHEPRTSAPVRDGAQDPTLD